MILGSTVGAVASVLSYHPAASSTSSLPVPPPTSPLDTTQSATPSPIPTQTAEPTVEPTVEPSAEPSASAKTPAKKKAPTQKSRSAGTSANSTPTSQATPTSTPPTKVTKDQTVTGATVETRWGPVQVQITIKDGKIVDAVGLQYPDGDRRSQWISEQAIPWLVEETLAEQIADVQIISGATYTSMGWRESLASAMQKAGL